MHAFTDEHVLYSKLRPNLNKVALPDTDGWCTTELLPLKPDPARLNRAYLAQYLRSPEFVSWAMSRTDGAKMPRVKVDELRAHCIPLPSIPEQKRIASILDKADAVRRKRSEAVGLADEFLRSVFLDSFGDPVTNPMGWPTSPIAGLCTIVRGSSPRPQGDPTYFGGPVPRLMVADLTRDGWFVTPQIDSLTLIGAQRSRRVAAGTIVMAVSGNVGLVARVNIDCCIHDGFVGFTDLDDSKALHNYLLPCLHFLKSTHERIQAGAIFQNLTTHDIKAMRVPLPPISKQLRFVKAFNLQLQLRHRLEIAGVEADGLFNSIQQRAFNGELAAA